MSDVALQIALGLSSSQYRNAQGIITAVKRRNLPQQAAVIAVETALTESDMRVLASANVPASQHYPHDLLSWASDGLGHDHGSCGLYQQQTGYAWTPANGGMAAVIGNAAMNQSTMTTRDGWGTPAELMNPETSTSLFLDALERTNWQSVSRWQAAQNVQHSAFSSGSNYAANDGRAVNIVTAMWPVTDQPIPHSEEDEDMAHIIEDQQTHALYLAGGARDPLKRISWANADAFAAICRQSKPFPQHPHAAIVAWDKRTRTVAAGVAA